MQLFCQKTQPDLRALFVRHTARIVHLSQKSTKIDLCEGLVS